MLSSSNTEENDEMKTLHIYSPSLSALGLIWGKSERINPF
jgi:hypothetical protein